MLNSEPQESVTVRFNSSQLLSDGQSTEIQNGLPRTSNVSLQTDSPSPSSTFDEYSGDTLDGNSEGVGMLVSSRTIASAKAMVRRLTFTWRPPRHLESFNYSA